MKRALLLWSCTALWAMPVVVQTDSLTTAPVAAQADSVTSDSLTISDYAIERVRGLEKARQAAMVAADTRTLAAIFAENATYGHANGLMQTRDELFRLLESGEIRYVAFELEDVKYRDYDHTVIGTGVQRLNVQSKGKTLALRSRYTVVYADAGGALKLVAYQSTPLPALTTKSSK